MNKSACQCGSIRMRMKKDPELMGDIDALAGCRCVNRAMQVTTTDAATYLRYNATCANDTAGSNFDTA